MGNILNDIRHILGASEASNAQLNTFDQAQGVGNAPGQKAETKADVAAAKKPPPPPKGVWNPNAGAVAPQTTAQTTPTTTPAAGTNPSSDISSLINALPGLTNQQKQALIASATAPTSAVAIFPTNTSLGVDPNANVYDATTSVQPAPLGGLGHGLTSPFTPTTTAGTQTANNYLLNLYKMTGPEISALQAQLWAGGWYAPTGITDFSAVKQGQPDMATIQAYSFALGQASRYTAAGEQIPISQIIAGGSGYAKPGTAANPGNYFFPEHNPVDIASAFRQESQQLTGTIQPTQSTQELQYMQGLEQQAAQGKDIAKTAGNAGQYETKPTDIGAAESFLLNNDPQAIQNYGAVARAQQFFSMLGSPAGMHG